ncbi:cation diffusion facilitator family transporter [Paracoccus sp. S1E-3]|uniref:cation diffusion facilitator family transporter n=1 Tax=Paracoccus sp. S1E-3 TaxID=2756130 RepID=UPI0015EF5EC4|nr:cation diffusion facilitator family transporter [Paracoccus sp. S1E-3]MBA4490316.1 cation transporter [Paracoccus sp. S1E-3]
MERLSTQTLAIGSVIVSLLVLVLALKIGAWWLTGSVALYSDALESLVNVVGALIAWVALRYAQKPPDRGHNYGHYKAEYFSAVAEGSMIIIAALLIVGAAVSSISDPGKPDLGPVGLGVNAIAMIVNLSWARVLIAAANKRSSPALLASGRHLMSDVWTSAGVLVGLVAASLTGWLILDPILAILVALNILREGSLVVLTSLDGLMDRALGRSEQDQIRDIIQKSLDGALQVHDLKTRAAGQATFVEFHLVVDSDMTVRRSHAICDRIEGAIHDEFPGATVTIHVEPDNKLKPTGIVPI